ncbi:MAG: 5'/3'-nucleotidase SurE [Desulfohalobiaceae bacterium]|nr:5'/3'-nucleotidase SurE [Desulfohalobiaceae bacterium]
MNIILTNDDGIWAVGLRCLARELQRAGHSVHIVAPLTEQSAVGHAVTLSVPLRIREVQEDHFQGTGVSGTPVDCVKMALGTVFRFQPDLLISGINGGANVGVDVLYSGTVAAATEAALVGTPSMAVSVDHFHPGDLTEQARYTARLLEQIDWPSLPASRVLNLNFPNCALEESRGLKCCPQTRAVYEDWYETRTDPRGRDYYWLCGEILEKNLEPETDRTLLTQGHITLTPLTFDFTDKMLLQELKKRLNSSP